MKKILLFLILLLSFSPTLAFGAEAIQQEAQKLETDVVDKAAKNMDAEMNFSELLAEVLSGEFPNSFISFNSPITISVSGKTLIIKSSQSSGSGIPYF